MVASRPWGCCGNIICPASTHCFIRHRFCAECAIPKSTFLLNFLVHFQRLSVLLFMQQRFQSFLFIFATGFYLSRCCWSGPRHIGVYLCQCFFKSAHILHCLCCCASALPFGSRQKYHKILIIFLGHCCRRCQRYSVGY